MHAVFTGVNWRDRKETANAFDNYFALPENERQQIVDELTLDEARQLMRMLQIAIAYIILSDDRTFNTDPLQDLNDRIGERALREIQS